nr:PREDICTED: uncharacterized protein LOC104145696 [Struthio camelus australis]
MTEATETLCDEEERHESMEENCLLMTIYDDVWCYLLELPPFPALLRVCFRSCLTLHLPMVLECPTAHQSRSSPCGRRNGCAVAPSTRAAGSAVSAFESETRIKEHQRETAALHATKAQSLALSKSPSNHPRRGSASCPAHVGRGDGDPNGNGRSGKRVLRARSGSCLMQQALGRPRRGISVPRSVPGAGWDANPSGLQLAAESEFLGPWQNYLFVAVVCCLNTCFLTTVFLLH